MSCGPASRAESILHLAFAFVLDEQTCAYTQKQFTMRGCSTFRPRPNATGLIGSRGCAITAASMAGAGRWAADARLHYLK